jgi:hypothetical protein
MLLFISVEIVVEKSQGTQQSEYDARRPVEAAFFLLDGTLALGRWLLP